MAEFDNEAANLDLFQEIFNARSSREGTTDVVSRTVNNVVDSNVNKHLHSSTFLKSSVVSNNIDNGMSTQTDVTCGLIEENTTIDVQDSVTLNNIENLKKKTESTNSTTVKNVDNKSDCTDDDHSNIAVNGNVNTVLKCDEKACGKQKKGISFPRDTFISGYFEPPDPWKNAPLWTTDELVSAYRKSCELHGTKPIAKLVQQLQTCSPGKQEELLSLKGEKLDQKQCECLEEVLRRVQFKLLDLEASHLDDECAVALFDMIEYYESACQLNISFNKNIQARGWQACSRLVRRTPNLTYLDMRSCDLNDRNIPIFARALKLGCHLTILHMESMNLSGRPLVILVTALKMNETLHELFLADNKLMPTDGVQLGNLLRYNRKLMLLDLRNNHLQDVGTSHIADGLMEQGKGPGLRTLVLWNNAINYQAMPALGRALAANESLETLNIGHNSLTNEGVHLLKDGLLKTNSLLRLGLQGTRITDEGAVALAEYIADSTILLRIDLRDNEIKTGGLMALSHAMRVNTSVTRIDLDKEPKKESSMKDYAEQQSHLLRDIYTFQQRNIQAALQKEEQERVELEMKVFSAASEEETRDKQMTETIPPNSSADSLTLLDKEEEKVQDKNVKQEKDKKDAENIKTKNIEEKLRESENQCEESDHDDMDFGLPKVDSSGLPKEDIKNRLRPSVLFPYLGLPPQASLDSPVPTSNVSPLVSVLSESVFVPQIPPQSLPPPKKNFLTLNTSSAPGEMILSPQYFPKQIARKIFSVSRVSEDPSWPQLSTSPTPPHSLSAAFDPLNVSSVPLVPISSSLLSSSMPPLSSSPVLIPQRTLGASQHSSAASQMSGSPSSSLFQDLAEETVRHMVSPILDIDVKSMLPRNVEPEKVTDNAAKFAVNNSTIPVFSEFSNASVETSLFSEQITLVKTLHASHDVVGSCDSLEPSVAETESSKPSSLSIFSENLCATNSGADNLVLTTSDTADRVQTGFTSGDGALQHELLLIQENTHDKACHESSSEASASSHEVDLFVYAHDISNQNDFSILTEDDGVLRGIPETDIQKNETGNDCNTRPPDSPFFTIEGSIGSSSDYSHLESQMPAYLQTAAGGDAMQGKVIPEKEALIQQHRQHPAEDSFSDNSLEGLHDKETHSLHIVTEINTTDEQLSVCLNNSSSPSLLLSEDTQESSPVRRVTNSKVSSSESGGNEEHSFSSFEDVSASGHEEVMQANDSSFSLRAHAAKVANDCTDSLTDVYNSNNDNIDIENVDFSLDEEPWLAIGAENDGNGSEKCKESLTQPDFFTTLSMNGLTQELASALTSLDGCTTSYGNEDDDLDLQPHDEFEKELDAMLAIVQGELPWPLQDS